MEDNVMDRFQSLSNRDKINVLWDAIEAIFIGINGEFKSEDREKVISQIMNKK